jgi:hypothetical protein
MNKQIFIISCLISFVILFLYSPSLAWDNEKTHKDLSFQASGSSSLGTAAILEKLGLKGALKQALKLEGKTKQIVEWLQEGAYLEDAGSNTDYVFGTARSFNHFHNPLKLWGSAGLNDSVTIIVPSIPPYVIKYSSSGESALKWAQDKAKQQSYSESKGLQGDQTWQTIRDYYYNALTGKTDLERQGYFARVFKGLGHQMHLIQDMAVPAHVRNDAHPEDALLGKNYITGDLYFETWAKTYPDKINGFTSTPIFPQVDLTKNPGGLVPISQFYDTDQYNENVVPTKSLTWGLSEYTNANFVSDDTIFTEKFSKNDGHYFPYPRYTDQTQCYEQFDQTYIATNKKRTYWRKKCVGEPVDHFVTVGPLFKYLPIWNLQRLTIKLDEATHNDYASLLIPRAVGYSEGLLNYFFRGDIRLEYVTSPNPGYVIVNNTGEKMEGDFVIFYDRAGDERVPLWAGRGTLEATIGDKTNTFDFIPPSDAKEPGKYIVVFKGKMGNEDGAVAGYVLQRLIEITPPDQFVYSMVDANQSDPYFTSIKAKVRNASPSEAIQNGVIQAIAKYKTDIDDADYIYSMSAPRSISSLASDQATEFEFDFSDDPIPVDATDLYLQVIFKGTIRNENNAVAIGIKDISEPTPIDVFNNMDRICINGHWYVTGTPEAYDALPPDAKLWDYWPHDLKDEYIKVSPVKNPCDACDASPSNYTFYRSLIEAGTLYRRFILCDYEFMHSGYGTMVPKDPNDHATHDNVIKKGTAQGGGVRNQEEYTTDQAVCSEYGLNAPCTVRLTSSFYPFRGVEMWGPGGIIVDGLTYPNYTDPNYIPCKWDDLNQ